MMEDYKKALEKLVAGDISEITVAPKDFLDFRKAWQDQPARKEVVGMAQRNGTIIYQFKENASD